MENNSDKKMCFEDLSKAEDNNESRMYQSQLFQTAKKAQQIFDYINSGIELQEWMKSHVVSAFEDLNTVCQNMEFDMAYPKQVDSLPDEKQDEKQENNYLSNEDKRYPAPQSSENGDDFMSRCIADPNMKNRYAEQSDRFLACMLIWQSPPENIADNPGEKFSDPMQPKDEAPVEPEKPILP